MSQFTVSMRIKELFFDRQKIINATDRASRRNLSKAGAFIRTSARSSIKPRSYKVSAPPGKPPFDHTGFKRRQINRQRRKIGQAPVRSNIGTQGLRAILFGFDPATRTLIVGPVGYGRSKEPAPRVQELGGTADRFGKKIVVRPHPYMMPALKKELPRLPKRWRGTVR